jgi:non-structural maintenance of chromosomes element 4
VLRSFNNREYMSKLKDFMLVKSGGKILDTNDDGDNESGDEEIENDDNDDDDDDDNMTLTNNRNKRTSTMSRTSAANQRKKNKSYVLTEKCITRFGEYATDYFFVPPRPKFLLGSLEKEFVPVVRKQRQQRVKDNANTPVKKTNIKQVDDKDADQNEKNNTVDETERIYKILSRFYRKSKGSAICLYEFMINPHSFSRSIENMFYISFLVKVGF